MREKLNENPLAQVVLIGVLLLGVGFFLMHSMGGGGEEGSGGETTATIETGGEGTLATLETSPAPATGGSAVPPPTKAPPADVVDAYKSGNTVAILFVHDGGIDDRLVRDAGERLAALPNVAYFVVPAAEISRYVAITGGVGVDRVPALVVIRPKRTSGSTPSALISYGFQSGESIVQAVIDAGYDGPTVDYHP